MSSGSVQIFPPHNDILSIGFNQDQSCFAVGTETGFKIYDCDPFGERCIRTFPQGGMQSVEMLFKCNILGLVGTGSNTTFPPNKVMIWDDQQAKGIGYLYFRSDVRSIRLRRDRILVALDHKTYCYNFVDLKLLQEFDTAPNPKGLSCLSPSARSNVMAVLGSEKGHVRVELAALRRTQIIRAHTSSLACMALSMDGTKLATASEKGTIIRVFNTANGDILHEFRRGSSKAEILSLAFHSQGSWICSTSDSGTVHVFSLLGAGSGEQRSSSGDHAVGEEQNAAENSRSSFYMFRGVLPQFFSSEWSFAQFRVNEPRSIAAFGTAHNTLIVISGSGVCYRCSFDPNSGGECKVESKFSFAVSDGPSPSHSIDNAE